MSTRLPMSSRGRTHAHRTGAPVRGAPQSRAQASPPASKSRRATSAIAANRGAQTVADFESKRRAAFDVDLFGKEHGILDIWRNRQDVGKRRLIEDSPVIARPHIDSRRDVFLHSKTRVAPASVLANPTVTLARGSSDPRRAACAGRLSAAVNGVGAPTGSAGARASCVCAGCVSVADGRGCAAATAARGAAGSWRGRGRRSRRWRRRRLPFHRSLRCRAACLCRRPTDDIDNHLSPVAGVPQPRPFINDHGYADVIRFTDCPRRRDQRALPRPEPAQCKEAGRLKRTAISRPVFSAV